MNDEFWNKLKEFRNYNILETLRVSSLIHHSSLIIKFLYVSVEIKLFLFPVSAIDNFKFKQK